ncbi:hypothetical protein B0H13DRAFT_1854880 [Mycena leptocephala]|nr:hypothetical protein B0H13DRAFT_1854880 [Mycena leptocephala]
MFGWFTTLIRQETRFWSSLVVSHATSEHYLARHVGQVSGRPLEVLILFDADLGASFPATPTKELLAQFVPLIIQKILLVAPTASQWDTLYGTIETDKPRAGNFSGDPHPFQIAPFLSSCCYEREHGFSHDILERVEDKELVDLGMSKGDAMRLKAGAQAWWNVPDAKRKRVDSSSAPAGFYGPRITPSKSQSDRDRITWYKTTAVKSGWAPLPAGHRAVVEEEWVDEDEVEENYRRNGGDVFDREAEAAKVLTTLYQS